MANDKHNRDHEIDVRTEMRIALFWRALIGDFEYIKFDPEDLLRWYEALDLRGPHEIRDLLTERYSTRPMPYVLTVVNRAPHPPVWLVREWLQFHEQKVRKGSYVWAAISFPIACVVFIPFIHGCVALQPMNPLVMKPPQTNPVVATVGGMPAYGASPPIAPTPTFQPSMTVTGPQSNGIAGGIAGASPAAGITGPTNSGASGNLNNSGAGGH